MKRAHAAIAAALLALLPAVALADAFNADGFNYSDDVTVNGIKNGQLDVSVQSNERLFDLSKVEWIELSQQPKFNEAEKSRKDAQKAAALYRQAVRNIDDPKLKVLAELRAVGPTDVDGKFSDAVSYFLDAYVASPTDSVWSLRPTHIPANTSTMLKDAAERIIAKIGSFHSQEAKKNLKTFELELLTKANDPRAAALAKELGVGGSDATTVGGKVPAAAPAEPPSPAVIGQGLQGVSDNVKTKNYDAAITQADSLLKTATGDTAVRLFELKAEALEGEKKFDLAAASYLRVIAHYPSNPNVIPDLMKAAELEKAMNHKEEAQRLTDEVKAIRNRPRN